MAPISVEEDLAADSLNLQSRARQQAASYYFCHGLTHHSEAGWIRQFESLQQRRESRV